MAEFDEVSEPHEKLSQKELAAEYARRIIAADFESPSGIDEVIRLRDEAHVAGIGGLLNLALNDYFETKIMRLVVSRREGQ